MLVQVDLALGRDEHAVPEDVVALLNGHIVPDAGLELRVVVAVGVGLAERSGLAGNVDETVGVEPHGIGADAVVLDASAGPLVSDGAGDIADEVRCYIHADLAVLSGMGGIGALGKVVDVRVHLFQREDALLDDFDFHLFSEVVDVLVGVILAVMLPVFRAERVAEAPALDVAGLRLEAELLEMAVVVLGHRCIAQEDAAHHDEIGDDGHSGVAEQGGERRAVVDARKGGDGVDEVAVSAGEQRGQVIRVGALALCLGAVGEQGANGADGGAAERVAEDDHLLVLLGHAEIFQDAVLKCLSVAGVMVFLTVDFSIVHRASEEIRPKDAGAVPSTVERAKGRGVVLNALLLHVLYKGTPVGEVLGDFVVVAPACEPVAEQDRISVCGCHTNFLSL